MELGTIVVAGRTLPVIRLALYEGNLQIIARVTAERDWPPLTDVPAAVFGQDGQGVCQGWRMSVPPVAAGENVMIILPIRISSLDP